MAITNLTGTKWVFNDDLNITSANTFLINFIDSDAIAYNAIKFFSGTGSSLQYFTNYPDEIEEAYSIYDGPFLGEQGWQNQSYKTITITGGQDITNTNLINWLESNAKQQQIITDLTGTTWAFNEIIMQNTFADYMGAYDINFTDQNLREWHIIEFFDGLAVNINYYPDSSYTSGIQAYHIEFYHEEIIDEPTWEPGTKIITITDGNDATNPNLIAILQNCAKQLIEYKTDSVEIGSIADAIRAKSGTYVSLTYPIEFVSAINSLPSPDIEDGIITQTISGAYENSRVTKIGDYTFISCTNLTSVNFSSCSTIGSSAFSGCSNLTSVNFPLCKTISGDAFTSCNSLVTVSFPSCTTIGYQAFGYCINLTSANFPSCTTVSGYVFAGCTNLKSVSFPVCTTIGSYMFSRCTNLKSVNFPLCKTIGSYAFSYCTSLASISFPSCTTIGSYAFIHCHNLISLYLTGSSYVSLSNSNAFSSTPIGGYSASAGKYGSIYVPASMLASYKTRTNWTYFSSRIIGV